MSHSSLSSPQEDAYMFGTEKNKPYRPEQRVLEGLLWSGRHCFVMVKVQLLGGKQTQSTLTFSVIRSGSNNRGEFGLFLFFLHLNLTFSPEDSERIL